MSTCDLANKTCEPCQGGMPTLTKSMAEPMMAELHDDWQLRDKATVLERKLLFKGFAKAVYHANAAALLADQQGHHPDISFGWGYCHIRFTTHEIGGLSENDFICAAKFDQMIAG